MRIVFMGTPDFAAVSLQRLLDERFDVVGVFTQPDKPKNRGMKLQPSPVKEIALAAGLPVFQPAKMRDGTALADLQSLRPDILVVVAYGRILPDDLLAVAPYGAVNVHGSLLPKYRGGAQRRCRDRCFDHVPRPRNGYRRRDLYRSDAGR